MRIPCPVCGERDRREFYYVGDAKIVNRPSSDASEDIWNDYLHNRENPAGVTRDLWYHESGCNSWLVVSRNTVTHEVVSADLATDLKGDLS
jgi:sarcosine oxidase subunit delta|tara:strand:+ start:302 stop:574 length:273 start_codon:yes stop_codon:yes gene_type:complete